MKQIIILASVIIGSQAHALRLASHIDVQLYKQERAGKILTKKDWIRELNSATELNVVAALAVLDDELSSKIIDRITFSNLALGMLVGNGDPIGVTSTLKYSKPEEAFVRSILKKALQYIPGKPYFATDTIWSSDYFPDATKDVHARALNALSGANTKGKLNPAVDPEDAREFVKLENFNEIPDESPLKSPSAFVKKIRDNFKVADPNKYQKFIWNLGNLDQNQLDVLVKAYNGYGDKNKFFENFYKNCQNEPVKYNVKAWVGRLEEAIKKITVSEKERIGLLYEGLSNGYAYNLVKTIRDSFKDADAEKYQQMISNLAELSQEDLNTLIVAFNGAADKNKFFENFYKNCERNDVAGWVGRLRGFFEEKKARAEQERIKQQQRQQARPINPGPWRFWANPQGNGGKPFEMPVGLTVEGQRYVSFFMTYVMKKLQELRDAGKISNTLVRMVIRAASMGLVGMTEQHIYLEAFEASLDSALANKNLDGIIFAPWNALIAPGSVSQEIKDKRRFPHINDGEKDNFGRVIQENLFFRGISPDNIPIETFVTLHTEEIMGSFVNEYNKLRPNERNKPKEVELKNKYKAYVSEKLLGLPNTIQETFGFLIDKNCADDIWVRFINVFNTNVCYDGTYDYISPTGIEILSSGDGGDKRTPNKIFAKMLTDIPKDLQPILTDQKIEEFVNSVKNARAEKNPTWFLAGKTIEDYFRGDWWDRNSTTNKIRNVVGQELNGSWKLTDPQILELIYWNYAMNIDGALPPGGLQGEIAKLFMEG